MDGRQGSSTMWPGVDMLGRGGYIIFRDACSLDDVERRLFRVVEESGVGIGVDVTGRKKFPSSGERTLRLARATDARSRNGRGRFDEEVEMRRRGSVPGRAGGFD